MPRTINLDALERRTGESIALDILNPLVPYLHPEIEELFVFVEYDFATPVNLVRKMCGHEFCLVAVDFYPLDTPILVRFSGNITPLQFGDAMQHLLKYIPSLKTIHTTVVRVPSLAHIAKTKLFIDFDDNNADDLVELDDELDGFNDLYLGVQDDDLDDYSEMA